MPAPDAGPAQGSGIVRAFSFELTAPATREQAEAALGSIGAGNGIAGHRVAGVFSGGRVVILEIMIYTPVTAEKIARAETLARAALERATADSAARFDPEQRLPGAVDTFLTGTIEDAGELAGTAGRAAGSAVSSTLGQLAGPLLVLGALAVAAVFFYARGARWGGAA
jgi:hypothetical protein